MTYRWNTKRLDILNRRASDSLLASSNLSDLTDTDTAIENLDIVDSVNSTLTIRPGAGAALTTGTYNIAIGENALNDATTAINCVAIGSEALAKVTTVTSNGLVAIGANALAANTTGQFNSAIGYNALLTNIGGSYNTAIGLEALKVNTSGAQNMGIGAWTLYSNTTGSNNCAIGYGAAFKQASGCESNTAVGSASLFNNVAGGYNTGVGSIALYNCLGTANSAIGYGAGDNITTGTYNLVLGATIDAPSATASYQLTIGNLYFGDTTGGTGTTAATGNAGIGEPTPTAKLHVKQTEASGNAKPVLKLEQLDVSEEMIEFDCTIGVGNGIEAIGAKAFTTTHFIKVTLPGGLTRYIEAGTIV